MKNKFGKFLLGVGIGTAIGAVYYFLQKSNRAKSGHDGKDCECDDCANADGDDLNVASLARDYVTLESKAKNKADAGFVPLSQTAPDVGEDFFNDKLSE